MVLWVSFHQIEEKFNSEKNLKRIDGYSVTCYFTFLTQIEFMTVNTCCFKWTEKKNLNEINVKMLTLACIWWKKRDIIFAHQIDSFRQNLEKYINNLNYGLHHGLAAPSGISSNGSVNDFVIQCIIVQWD